uniref:Uncharacterized protein n=1 Tax=Arundo donax TaxID=35708 RepID=A0A0A8Z0H6_ARUDO
MMKKHFIDNSSAPPLATSSFSLLIDILSLAMSSCFRNRFFSSCNILCPNLCKLSSTQRHT